ncbi:MAG: hypothetical protein IPM43_13230 [Actinomycetota bacterium]|nr:MAG: hypothetical protein IPM43_13230 [Actinomycetota bacterium]
MIAVAQLQEASLVRFGLHPGEPVRFRKGERGRWHHGRLAAVERDGSLLLHDADGAARSLRPERIEVRRPGSRGRLRWCNVADVAVTWEQLALWV